MDNLYFKFMSNLIIIIKLLFNYLMSNVFELSINLKTKNKRHEESFGIAT